MAGFDWASAAATLGGGLLSFGGNLLGTSKAVKGQKKALKEAEKIRAAANERALEYLKPDLNSDASDALLRQMLTVHPERLTPSQQISLEDVTRQTRNNISAMGLRGSGRAGAGLVDDTTRRFMADAYDANQGRSDDAAKLLSQRGFTARTGAANIESGAGGADAAAALGVGSDIAGMQGNQWTANANVLGSTFGAIASLANDARARKKYPTPSVTITP